MNFKKAAAIGIILIAALIFIGLMYYYATPADNIDRSGGGSYGRDGGHAGGGWILWDTGDSSRDSGSAYDTLPSDSPTYPDVSGPEDDTPTTSFEDFYGSGQGGDSSGDSEETSFEDFYSDSGDYDSGRDTSFGDFFSDSWGDSGSSDGIDGSDWSDGGDWGDSSDWGDTGDWGDSGDFGGDFDSDW